MGFLFRRVGVFDVEVEDGPVDTITRRLGIAGLQALRLNLGAQLNNLRVDLFAISGVGGAHQTLTQVGGFALDRSGLVVELFRTLPVRAGGGFGLLA